MFLPKYPMSLVTWTTVAVMPLRSVTNPAVFIIMSIKNISKCKKETGNTSKWGVSIPFNNNPQWRWYRFFLLVRTKWSRVVVLVRHSVHERRSRLSLNTRLPSYGSLTIWKVIGQYTAAFEFSSKIQSWQLTITHGKYFFQALIVQYLIDENHFPEI